MSDLQDNARREFQEQLRRMEDVLSGPVPMTLAEILNDPKVLAEPEAVAPRLAYESRASLLVAREKEGKSTTARYAAAQVSRGGYFLGKRCQQRPVLLVVLEEYLGDVARQLANFNADPENVYIVDRLADPLADFNELVHGLKPGLVVVDTLAAFANLTAEPPKPGDSAAWTPIMVGLTQPCRDTGTALLLLAHANKSTGEYRDSTAIGANVDMILTMRAGSDANTRTVKPKGRWRLDEYTFQFADNEMRITDGELSIEARVLSYIISDPGCSTRKLRDAIGARASGVDEALRKLLKDDSVHDHGSANGRKLYAPPACPEACPASSEHQPELGTVVSEDSPSGTHPGHTPDTGDGHTTSPTVSHPQTEGGTGGTDRDTVPDGQERAA